MSQYKRLGELLVARGHLRESQLKRALAIQAKEGGRFGSILVAKGWSTEEHVAQCLAVQFDMPCVDPTSLTPDEEAVHLVRPIFALNHLAVPYRVERDRVHVLMADPLDIDTSDTLQAQFGKPLVIAISTESSLRRMIAEWFRLPGRGFLFGVDGGADGAAPKKRRRRMRVDPQSDRGELLDRLSYALAA